MEAGSDNLESYQLELLGLRQSRLSCRTGGEEIVPAGTEAGWGATRTEAGWGAAVTKAGNASLKAGGWVGPVSTDFNTGRKLTCHG